MSCGCEGMGEVEGGWQQRPRVVLVLVLVQCSYVPAMLGLRDGCMQGMLRQQQQQQHIVVVRYS